MGECSKRMENNLFGDYEGPDDYFDDFSERYLTSEMFSKLKGKMFMAFDDEELVAMVSSMETSPKNFELKRNFVSARYQRQGIAKTLIQQLIADAKERRYTKIILDSAEFMHGPIPCIKNGDFGNHNRLVRHNLKIIIFQPSFMNSICK